MKHLLQRLATGRPTGVGRVPSGQPSTPGSDQATAERGASLFGPSAALAVSGASSVALGLIGALGAACVGTWIAGQRDLSATQLGGGLDADSDGLLNDQELVSGTNPLQADSDLDGFVDLVELARQSDPVASGSVPPQYSELSVGLTAFSDNGIVFLTTAIYLPGNHQGGLGLKFGLRFAGVTLPISYSELAPISLLESFQVGDNALVFKVTTPIPDALLQSLGDFSMYAQLSPGPGAPAISASVLNFQPQGGVLNQRRQTTQGPQGLIYQPIVPPQSLPAEFQKDKICQQLTIAVGQSGATQLLLIESSGCEAAAGYCIPNCAGEVGNTIEVIDPLALIGG